ncbi:predicted protein [Lichtheimia corymbifera JMRC:FSU:9682]|uniref:Uncharacterized protein n=1 Tax=Lichtheimia corymbifera JMRC:FSU:9682 TaxID=1263082 RepID=A0A068RXL3_9FUNG|nr:predicted protein [Lichtheimia corymbifera JMRC:FSU:9682]
MAISLLPLVRCYSRSMLGVNRASRRWLLWRLFQLNYATPWLSISSSQQQRAFVYMEKFLVRRYNWGIIISLGSTPACIKWLCTSQFAEKASWNAPRALKACVELDASMTMGFWKNMVTVLKLVLSL